MENGLMSRSSVKLISTLAICTLTAGIVYLSIRRKRNRKYEEFVLVGKVDQLYIYPVKSCRGNKVDWMDCGVRGSRRGEERDRQFMLVDSLQDNLYIRAILYPKMVLVESHLEQAKLTLKFPTENDGYDQIIVDLGQVRERNEKRRVRMYFDERIDGLDCGDEIAQKFDEFLNIKGKRAFRLIWFSDEENYTERNDVQKREHWVNYPLPQIEDKMFFHDTAAYMGFSLGSVQDLNRHLAKIGMPAVDARNFRPNLVISGVPPFDEDCWLRVRAGQAEFLSYKPCMRCVLTTINPDTGVKCAKMEPLKELKKYRKRPEIMTSECKESPVFGANMAVMKAGRVRVGDPVYIQYKPKPFC